MAPEQIDGKEVGPSTDLYSLACLAFECMIGEVPFPNANPVAVLDAHRRTAPPRPSASAPLPPSVDDEIERALAKEPADRHGSCGEFALGLGRALRQKRFGDAATRRRNPHQMPKDGSTRDRARRGRSEGATADSPAEPRFAFIYDGDVYTLAPYGSDLRRVTAIGECLSPAWSPDRRTLAFVRDGDIFVTEPDGDRQRHRLTRSGDNGEPSWSPDGHRLVFESDGLWVMEADGSGRKRLPDDLGGGAASEPGFRPAWSPDGDRIAFDNGRLVFVGRLDSDEDALIVAKGINPSWAADGLGILFERSRNIYLVSVEDESEEETKLTWGPSYDRDPVWLPDGSIAFLRHGRLYLFDPTGRVRRLTDMVGLFDLAVAL